jgi:hypothetical protein
VVIIYDKVCHDPPYWANAIILYLESHCLAGARLAYKLASGYP